MQSWSNNLFLSPPPLSLSLLSTLSPLSQFFLSCDLFSYFASGDRDLVPIWILLQLPVEIVPDRKSYACTPAILFNEFRNQVEGDAEDGGLHAASPCIQRSAIMGAPWRANDFR